MGIYRYYEPARPLLRYSANLLYLQLKINKIGYYSNKSFLFTAYWLEQKKYFVYIAYTSLPWVTSEKD